MSLFNMASGRKVEFRYLLFQKTKSCQPSFCGLKYWVQKNAGR